MLLRNGYRIVSLRFVSLSEQYNHVLKAGLYSSHISIGFEVSKGLSTVLVHKRIPNRSNIVIRVRNEDEN